MLSSIFAHACDVDRAGVPFTNLPFDLPFDPPEVFLELLTVVQNRPEVSIVLATGSRIHPHPALLVILGIDLDVNLRSKRKVKFYQLDLPI